ncbi:dihydropteroate synthase [Candidatus Aerophobetes bacterium]|nr:dihydropteroate synthase [Candidatus Aerophobetes bacterium]
MFHKIKKPLEKKEDRFNKWIIKDRVLNTKNPLIMGILNITSDSFYDGGKYIDGKRAVERAHQMKEEGADIIDIGGESTRPESEPIPVSIELKRVIPVIEKLSNVGIPVSIDTYKKGVAEEAIDAGASIVNDISGLRFDKKLPSIIAEKKVGYILMHMLGTPKNMQKNPYYDNVIDEILNFFKERLKFAQNSGISYENIVIDPGIGFGKRLEDNIEIIRNIQTFTSLGRPILLGVSRKSFIGGITGLDKDERLEGSLAAVSSGFYGGVRIFRVHDVKETKRFLMVLNNLRT